MVLRAVAVGFAGILAFGCARSSHPVTAPTVIVVDGASGPTPVISSFEAPDHHPTWTARDEVEVEWHGSWWPAVVMEKRGARWLVHYEGYAEDWDEVVGSERIRERRVELKPPDSPETEDEPDP